MAEDALSGSEPPLLDTGHPHSARVMNYWLGGKDNYPADRVMGDEVIAHSPEIVEAARADRAFLVRVGTHLVREAGIRQFLDLGTGLPTASNTHEVVQAAAPECRVVYVDNDPMVLAHARALLVSTPEGGTTYVDSDLRDVDTVLRQAAGLLDFTQPIALTILGTMLHIEDADAYPTVRRYTDALPSGSYLVLGDSTNTSDNIVASAERWNASSPTPVHLRSPEQLGRFFDGLEIEEPGIVPVPLWRPEPYEVGAANADIDAYCGLGRKP
ncbi:hypothetical protein F4561_003184 [Lipingzhangella halophila]|uniref:S-adenosyl methyltransferase n=2 Tax=Lipingzhangella halophila TaxID=1783352 RepID=A0A7W7RI03_9ACTN|nr:SAM-dependent methyltransferase [Lipingzhangella halophila]MBB4932364.1 hypothetical protein [Lipingzhangella halophila]